MLCSVFKNGKLFFVLRSLGYELLEQLLANLIVRGQLCDELLDLHVERRKVIRRRHGKLLKLNIERDEGVPVKGVTTTYVHVGTGHQCVQVHANVVMVAVISGGLPAVVLLSGPWCIW